MARPKKQKVDYFPHYCLHGSTMFILEQKYGNDGYAFWFKLLEYLGQEAGHYLNFNCEMKWEFLQAKTRLSGDICEEMLNLLSKVGAIDPELWAQKIVWSQNFLDGISVVYKNRRVEIPSKPTFLRDKTPIAGVSTPDNTQSIVKESIVEVQAEEKPADAPIDNYEQEKDLICKSIQSKIPRDIFNVFSWAEKHKKKNHSAVLHTLRRLDAEAALIASGSIKPWPYAKKIMDSENGNYNAREYVAKAEMEKAAEARDVAAMMAGIGKRPQ